ncbi:hypothetical protein SAMN05192561_1088 [Halopenitus malekzadehii]|uniref:Uncharacterized protein n=1 Tax=Halopenitus malekzadehii TaxID=1267564 RepID=A0A1H6J447_9EURY|nr:hypothetical protein [Halopenitus malekzadehii]SEH56846.1 hypothetical protein SAMN05192561_1088 [Halopenitus malekzadehii]
MQRSTVGIAALLVAVAIGLAVSGVVPEPGVEPDQGAEPDPPSVPEGSLVTVDGEYALWPYTSRERSSAGRTLAINVVFRDDPETVREALQNDPDADWREPPDADTSGTEQEESSDAGGSANATAEETNASPTNASEEPASDEPASDVNVSDVDEELIEEAVTTDWQRAHGSRRYAYFEHEGGHGTWVAETFQLHAGTYLGTRTHIRGYGSPDGTYTAVQAHGEYYDWFRLRHTVTDVSESARTVENDFIDSGATVAREYHGIDGGRSDGWLSVIDLAALPFLAVLLRRTTRRSIRVAGRRFLADAVRHRYAALLGVGLAALVLGVRASGIAFEAAYPTLSPKVAAAPLYLVLAVGLPAFTASIADHCDPDVAVLGVTLGLGGGFLIDFASLGVAVPAGLLAHRVAVVAALATIAAGRAMEGRDAMDGRSAVDGRSVVDGRDTVDDDGELAVDNNAEETLPGLAIVAVGLFGWAIVLALPLANVI